MKGVKQEKLSGAEFFDVETPEVGWIRVVHENDSSELDSYLVGSWKDSAGRTVTERKPTGCKRPFWGGPEVNGFVIRMIGKVEAKAKDNLSNEEMADMRFMNHAMNAFREKNYECTVSDGGGTDVLTVSKGGLSEWVALQMKTNGQPNGVITIRNKEQVEQLHFMLGQLLKTQ